VQVAAREADRRQEVARLHQLPVMSQAARSNAPSWL